MTRSQIMTLVCAFGGLALGLLLANLQFHELHVLRGAYMLYSVVGFITGYMTGGWLFFDRGALKTVKN